MYTHETDDAGVITFLPEDIDQGALVDITPLGSRFRVFLDTESGEKIDCEEVHKRYLSALGEAPTPEQSFDPGALLAGNLGKGRPWPEE